MEVVGQSPEPLAHDKNARLFKLSLLLTITIFAKIKYKDSKLENISESEE